MSNPIVPAGQNEPKPLAPVLFEKFIDNQTKELELRSQELVLQKQKDKNAFDFGREALGTKAQDRKDHREHLLKAKKLTYIFSTIISLAVIGMIVFALHMGKEAFATEIIKACVFVFTGGAGGYGIAKAKAHKDAQMSSGSSRGEPNA